LEGADSRDGILILEEWTVPIDQTTNNVDRPNLGNLIEEHQPRLKSYIRKRVSNKEDADDILQDVFYQLVKSFDETVSPIYEVSAWLYRVAHNTIVNKYKKKKEASLPDSETDETFLEDLSEILIGSEDTAPSPEMEYLRSLVWVELEQALGELPAEQRRFPKRQAFLSTPYYHANIMLSSTCESSWQNCTTTSSANEY